MAAQESQACNFKDPKNLKDILELLAKLGDASSLKKSVGQKLVQDVQKYFKDADRFYSSSRSSGIFSSVFSNASLIRASILKNSQSSESYGKYSGLTDDAHASHKDCGEKISEALKKFLPQGYAALYYLYFMCSNDCSGIKGGQWKNQNVNDSRTSLGQWLIAGSDDDLIKRGFSQGKLKESNDGQIVAPLIAKIIKHDTPGPLQKVLVFLLFSCPWDDALTGHAICFLYTFCSQVSAEEGLEGKLKGYSGKLKTVCQDLQRNLTPLVNGTQGGLSAVCHDNTNLFDSLWDDQKFLQYCEWLKENIYSVIASLASMSLESPGWVSSSIQNAYSAGPFQYGFVFKDGSWKDYVTRGNLQGPITSLIESLEKLKKALEPSSSVSSSSSSSAGATAAGAAGGIFGLGGAGAGVAYATNAFGLKDIITGLISGFLK